MRTLTLSDNSVNSFVAFIKIAPPIGSLKTFQRNIDYLKDNWTQKEVDKFKPRKGILELVTFFRKMDNEGYYLTLITTFPFARPLAT